MRWKKITLLGVGLIGGSLGKALRARHLADSVIGWVRHKSRISEAIACGAVDFATLDLQEAASQSDLIVLCTPLGVMDKLLTQILPFLPPKAIITDVGSAKKVICDRVELILTNYPNIFIGSHPMAGAEKSGVARASEDLFVNAVCAITPLKNASTEAVDRIALLWKSVGAKVKKMTPDQHDDWVSRTSHLPHVVASVLANYVLDPQFDAEQRLLCAGGFRDTTRIAAGCAKMWKDILDQNREALTKALADYLCDLQRFQKAISKGDHAQIEQILSAASSRRQDWEKQICQMKNQK